MDLKLTLSAEEIASYKFQNVPRGYDALEVDKYLDIIINDYQLIQSNGLIQKRDLDELKKRNEALEKEINELRVQIAELKTQAPNIKNIGNANSDNIKLLKKIDAYEKFLWKNGFNPNNIK